MTHVRIPDFSQPAPIRAPVRLGLPVIERRRHDAATTLPNEAVPGEIEPWEAVHPVRPDTPFVRARRVMEAAGDLLAACIIIGGGAYLVGLASLL